MERFNIDYSKKNIPIPTEKEYQIQLIDKVESFTKRMGWKALEFLRKLNSSEKETFGFKSCKCLPSVDELAGFESDLLMMVHSIEFRPVRNNFLSKLKEDVKVINNTKELLVNADKSTNIYKMNEDVYNKYLTENITKTYKKPNKNKVKRINSEAKKIAGKLKLEDRIQQLQEREAFISVKDHKEGFPNSPSFRLINPSKSEIGKISKHILDQINKSLLSNTKVNQQKNFTDDITWFKNINSEEQSSFLNVDVENFYPSISGKLLIDAINFAKSSINITEQGLSIIMQSRKTLLFQNSESWVKKTGNEYFDVPMGCYDGADICELVGSFILNKLTSIINKSNIGLYRDDGLGIFQNVSKPEIERKKKVIVKIFKGCCLTITIQCNLKIVDFLDVTFHLENNVYKPFRKENNKPIYIDKHSKHPASILKQLPKSIEKRILQNSSDKDILDESIKPYKGALK